MNHIAVALATRGNIQPSGGIPLVTNGMLVWIRVNTSSGGGTYTKGSTRLPRYTFNKPPKIITVSVFVYGQIYSDTFMVDPNIEITVDDIEVKETADGGIDAIEVVGIEILNRKSCADEIGCGNDRQG